jgi:SAM-dependent methyltransferase
VTNEPEQPRARPFGEVFLPVQRSNHGLADDDDYITSGVAQARQLDQIAGGLRTADLLDFGCGQGRLANSLIVADLRPHSYLGIDTNARSIAWCREFITERTEPTFRFDHVPAHNRRYNPSAVGRPSLPIGDSSKDVVFLNSVFSHMLSDDVSFYAAEFARVLRPDGVVYLTAFIEENVPDEEENPAGYLDHLGSSTGALHWVRYERRYFESLLREAGLRIDEIRHRAVEHSQQSIVVARPH